MTPSRPHDALARPTGYSLMQNGGASPPGEPFAVSYAYDALGRLGGVGFNAEAQSRRGFEYQYLAGSDLVSGYTSGSFSRSVAYEPHRDLVSAVANAASDLSPFQPFNFSTDYVWGLDLDGTLQGAGGVGGLLAVVRDDGVFLPTYDANGNISEYVSEGGEVVAHYDFSPFGETLIESGDLASTLTHRFSTKPWCPVTGLCEYQMRKYRPGIGRWLSRDPIGEDGGEGLYCYAFNSPMDSIDFIGLSIFDWKIWPWNWFRNNDGCKSKFKFEDLGWEYQRTMDGLNFEYEIIDIDANMIYKKNIIVPTTPDFGYTISTFNMEGYSCCCDKTGRYTSMFFFSVFSKTFILDRNEIEWEDDNRRFNDPRVDEYWRHSMKWWRRHMTRVHEKRHRRHAKTNYDIIVDTLRRAIRQYDSEEECLSDAERILKEAKERFLKLQKEAADKVENGEL